MTTEYSSVITPIPDANTAESIAYGSNYEFAKSSKFYWDSVEDYLLKLLKTTMLDIIDPVFCEYVVRRNPAMIYAKEPPVDSVDRIRDLHTLKILLNMKKALHEVDIRRTENLQYAQIHGIAEHSAKMRENGIDEDLWKASTLRYDEPIEYDTIRAKRDMDEKMAKYDAKILERRIQEYRRMRDMEATIQEEESKQEPAIEIVREIEELEIPIYKEIDVTEESEYEEEETTASENGEPNDCSDSNDETMDDGEAVECDCNQPAGGDPGDYQEGEDDEEDQRTEDDTERETDGIRGQSEKDILEPVEKVTAEGGEGDE